MPLLDAIDDLSDDDERLWTLVSTEFTCVFPAGEGPAPHLVRKIRAFDPNYVPLWMRKVYKDPGGTELAFGYHVIGRWAPMPDDEGRLPLRIERPLLKSVLFPFEGGVVYDQKTICDEWTHGSKERRLKCPDIYVPFDRRLVTWMDAAHRRLMREQGNAKQKVLDEIDRQKAVETKALETVEDDARRSLNSDRNMIRRAIDEGRLSDDPAPDPKPYVQATTVFEGAAQ